MDKYVVREAKEIVRFVDCRTIPDKLEYSGRETCTDLAEFGTKYDAMAYIKQNPSRVLAVKDKGFERYGIFKHCVFHVTDTGETHIATADYPVADFTKPFLWENVKYKKDVYHQTEISRHKWFADEISMGGYESNAVRDGDMVAPDGTAPLYLIRWDIIDSDNDHAPMYNDKKADYLYTTDKRVKVKPVV